MVATTIRRSSSGPSGPKDTSGLLANIVDETKNAKKGGTYIGSHPGVILTHDPMKTGINIRGARRGFSQLLRVADGFMAGADGTIEGDLAQSYELSPDKLTLTLKLDPAAGFAPVAPVNGRIADSEDVVFSWNRLQNEGIGASEVSNAKNPGAPITSVTAPDSKTVVIKLNQPNSTILSLIGSQVLGHLVHPGQGGGGPGEDRDRAQAHRHRAVLPRRRLRSEVQLAQEPQLQAREAHQRRALRRAHRGARDPGAGDRCRSVPRRRHL